jgi:hypothetical protein
VLVKAKSRGGLRVCDVDTWAFQGLHHLLHPNMAVKRSVGEVLAVCVCGVDGLWLLLGQGCGPAGVWASRGVGQQGCGPAGVWASRGVGQQGCGPAGVWASRGVGKQALVSYMVFIPQLAQYHGV